MEKLRQDLVDLIGAGLGALVVVLNAEGLDQLGFIYIQSFSGGNTCGATRDIDAQYFLFNFHRSGIYKQKKTNVNNG